MGQAVVNPDPDTSWSVPPSGFLRFSQGPCQYHNRITNCPDQDLLAPPAWINYSKAVPRPGDQGGLMGGSDKSLIECALGLLPNPIWPVESIFWLVLSRFLQILRAGGNLFPSRPFTILTLTIPIATPPGEIPSLPPPGMQPRPGSSSSLCSKVSANAEMRQKKSVLHPFFFNLPLSLFLIFCVFGWVLSFGVWDLVPQPRPLALDAWSQP